MRSTRLLALAVAFLMVLSAAPHSAGMGVQSPAAQPSFNPSSTPGAFHPDYILLGALHGSTVLQSDRPQSANLAGGMQFSATYYTANDLQNAYGASSLFTSGDNGNGKTIAIIDAYGDPMITQDLAAFDKEFGLPAASLTVIPVGAYRPENGILYGWDAETALDVEAAHAMAPAAHINLLVATNASNALYQAVKMVVDRHLGDVVSMSWGLGENSYGESGFSAAGYLNYAYLDYYLQQGSAEGITFFAASGDYGAFGGTTTVTAGFPASSPFVTGVGGTTLFLNPSSSLFSTAQYSGEAAWSVSPQYLGPQGVSSGGGYSQLFARPSYQDGAVSSQTRGTPDVAADANPYTGMAIVLEGGTYVIGGTSLSSPLWAGMAADLDQFVGKDLGALNPYLYSVYSDPQAYAGAFHQVTFGFNGVYQAGSGYNLVTGLGSPVLPQLARDIRSQASNTGLSAGSSSAHLSVAVGTSSGPSTSAPAQYTYGKNFTISATIETPQGSPASTGSFTAEITSPGGPVASVPLSYSGGSWTGSYSIGSSDPPGSWTITVTGSSGGYSGAGFADVNVGDSLAILTPVPYPYAPPTPPGTTFTVSVDASTPSGEPLPGESLSAYLIYGRTLVAETQLTDLGFGQYLADFTLKSSDPQGSYTLIVNGTGVGSVYSYLYVGEGLTGVILGPNDEAIPSASPGQLITLLATPQTSAGIGIFTSSVTAEIFSLSGAKVATIPLEPAPNRAQFGVFNFFTYQQANYTIPSGLAPGFYKVAFQSSYSGQGSVTQLGNFTTGFYVSPPPLSHTVSHVSSIFEGQTLTIDAVVTDQSGRVVTSGVFFATAIPSGYTYESYLTDAYGYTGIPMQYVSSIGEWEGRYQIPSTLTSPNPFTGNILAVNAGSWTVFVAGESSSAVNVVPAGSYVDVLPFTYIPPETLSPSTVGAAPLVTGNASSYYLRGAAASALTVSGLNITLAGDSIDRLTVTNSTVTLDGTQAGSLSASGSSITLQGGTEVGNLSLSSARLTVSGGTYDHLDPARPAFQVGGLSSPIGSPTGFTVTVTGAHIDNSTLSVSVDGAPVAATSAPVSGGYTLSGTIDPSALADGSHTLMVNATQSDGVTTSFASPFNSDAQLTSLSEKMSTFSQEAALWLNISYALAVMAILAFVLALWAVRKRPAPPPQGPGQV